MPRGAIQTVQRRVQSLRLARDIRASGLFEPDTYLSNNPDIGKIDALKHWLLYGRFEGRVLNFSAMSEWLLPHVIGGELTPVVACELCGSEGDVKALEALSRRYGLNFNDYVYYRALKNGEFDKAYECLSLVSDRVHFKGAHYFASRLMRLGELQKAYAWGRSLEKPDLDITRQCLDMARAMGHPTSPDVVRLIAPLADEFHPLDAQIFKARLPVIKENEVGLGPKLYQAGLKTVNETMPGRLGEFARECKRYSALINAATYNAVFDDTVCANRAQHGQYETQSLLSVQEAGLECLKVRLLMPYYWVYPQNQHRVTGPVLRLHKALIEQALNAGKWIAPIFATPIFDISNEDNYGLETLSYHTVTRNTPEHACTHYKESYLPGYFSHNEQGFSGWSSLAERDIDFFWHEPEAANDFHGLLYDRFVKGNVSKYNQGSSDTPTLPDSDFIFAALQVPDDSVSRWSYRPMKEWLTDVCRFGQLHNIPVVIKRHPLDKSLGMTEIVEHCRSTFGAIVSQAPIHVLIARSRAVVTVNSGVGFEALIHKKPVISCGKTDYGAATAIGDSKKTLESALENAIHGRHPIMPDQVRQFLATFLQQHCYNDIA